MNSSHQIPDPSLDEQAALWAARIDRGTLTAEEQAQLDAWLAASQVNQAHLESYLDLSDKLDAALPRLAASGAVSVPQALRKPKLRSLWLPTLAGAAAAVAVGLWIARPSIHPENFETTSAQRRSITLRDGTFVDLNSNTNLKVENGPKERRVRLGEGEAFFRVSKDKSRPFIVETAAGSVRVTGTVFDVRTESDSQLEVTVVEGSVQVRNNQTADDPSAQTFSLRAGDRVSLSARSADFVALSARDLDAAVAWRQGQIVFNGVLLKDALERFARYHGRVVTVAPDAAGLRLGGRFSLDDFDGFFQALEEALPVKVSREPDGNVRVGLRQSH